MPTIQEMFDKVKQKNIVDAESIFESVMLSRIKTEIGEVDRGMFSEGVKYKVGQTLEIEDDEVEVVDIDPDKETLVVEYPSGKQTTFSFAELETLESEDDDEEEKDDEDLEDDMEDMLDADDDDEEEIEESVNSIFGDEIGHLFHTSAYRGLLESLDEENITEKQLKDIQEKAYAVLTSKGITESEYTKLNALIKDLSPISEDTAARIKQIPNDLEKQINAANSDRNLIGAKESIENAIDNGYLVDVKTYRKLEQAWLNKAMKVYKFNDEEQRDIMAPIVDKIAKARKSGELEKIEADIQKDKDLSKNIKRVLVALSEMRYTFMFLGANK